MTIYSHPIEKTEVDVCVVGAGPVGIAVALCLEDRGLRVALLEAGNARPRSAAMADGMFAATEGHQAPLEVASCQALGGTSHWWGGRCVAFDEVDFAKRDYLPEAAWPIPLKDISRWWPETSAYFRCGSGTVTAEADIFGDARFDRLERWATQTYTGGLYVDRLRQSRNIDVFLNCSVDKLVLTQDGGNVSTIQISGKSLDIHAKAFVLAGGGLGTARLLLTTQQDWPQHFGGEAGPLGRYYMGHISGKIADIILANPSDVERFDYFVDQGAFVRRRFTIDEPSQLKHRLFNAAFWADNPPFFNPDHRSGTLSMVWLALATPLIGRRLVSEGVRLSHLGPEPRPVMRHIANVLEQPLHVVENVFRIMAGRYGANPRKPGFLIRNKVGRYAVHYHAEQSPNPLSCVRLSSRRDESGVPLLDIDFRYSEVDVQSVIKSHDLLDASLQRVGRGRLEYNSRRDELRAQVWSQARDGIHQIGLTRMGEVPATSVVNPDCQVHGISNLYLATSGIFPSSGQATPTFMAVAMGLRLADLLARRLKTVARLDTVPAMA